jgi:hypothetical protein
MSDDITRNYHRGNQESRAAKLLSERHAQKQRRRIEALALRRAKQGITCDEAEILLDLPHQSCSARFTELKRDKILIPTKLTRKTRYGGNARVLRAKS